MEGIQFMVWDIIPLYFFVNRNQKNYPGGGGKVCYYFNSTFASIFYKSACFAYWLMLQQIIVFKITRSDIEKLPFETSDFDTITNALPSGVYTTFRTYAGRTKVIGLHSHLERLYLPAKVQDILPAVRKPEDFRETLVDLLLRMDEGEARVRLILDTSAEPGIMYALLQPVPILPDEIYQNGVKLDVSKSSREQPSLKPTAFIREIGLRASEQER